MRVCFLTHYFPPEVGAPQTRIELLARTLAQQGAEVVVHTCFPHYPDGVVRAPYRNRPWFVERRDGIRVVRSLVYPARNAGFIPRLLDHASFALSAPATARLSGSIDVVVAETPPLFTAAAGVVYATVKRAACVVNVADRWPASAIELGALRHPGAIAAAEALERWIYRQADRIVAPTAGIVAALGGHPDAALKCRRVWPVIDVERFDPRLPSRSAPGLDPLRVLYAGTVGLAQGLEVLVEAARLAGAGVVQLTIAGDGAELPRIRALVAQRAASNVRLLGAVRAEHIPALYADADAGAVLLRDLPIFRGALPTKMFEVMAAGRPLLVAAPGESAAIAHEAKAGLVVAPGDTAGLADAFRRLRADPALRVALGGAGRRYAEERLGARRAADAWLEQLNDAIAARDERIRRTSPAAAGRRPVG